MGAQHCKVRFDRKREKYKEKGRKDGREERRKQNKTEEKEKRTLEKDNNRELHSTPESRNRRETALREETEQTSVVP